jgi:hypothetical protein
MAFFFFFFFNFIFPILFIAFELKLVCKSTYMFTGYLATKLAV